MLSSLPTCAAFRSKSNGKYLRSSAEDGEGANGGQLLQLTGDDAENLLTRFFVETSSKHDGLVHIRCYNNKYLVAERHHGDDWWIAGSADKPEEDLSQESSTLFQLKPVEGDPMTIRFYHARLGKFFGIFSNSNGADEISEAFMHVIDEERSEQFVLEFFQYVLPKYVCFKGDNGKYLRAQSQQNNPVLVFESEDINDPTVRNTTTGNRDGTMRIKSDHSDRFWRNPVSPNLGPWIRADSSDTSNDDPNTLFLASYTGGAIRLLNLGSNRYCKRLTTLNLEHGLAATGTQLEPWSRLQFEEPVLSRRITAILKPENAIIFGEKLLILATASVTNNTSSVMPRAKLTFDYTLEEMRRWHSMVHLKSPAQTLITSEDVYVQYGFIAVAPRFFNGMISWGTSIEKTSKVTEALFVDVPPMTKVTVTCKAVMSSYKLPFSYRQADKLIDGEIVEVQYDDGLYSGRNAHSFMYDTNEEKFNQ
ncbi:hypothetical protein BAE44_0020052 [Dichanthelium oligosanthes]|uniref:Agglutinin domain-containing protein n=1 Tax=Dichanthelium oligosanthes TaxID=888268 RepID=A0A1E5V1A8_9POAL|nr:hypothetical protein BAE44_0020052 [Dichanthelium oligosanthes]